MPGAPVVGMNAALALRSHLRRFTFDVVNMHFLNPHLMPILLNRAIRSPPIVLSLVGRSDYTIPGSTSLRDSFRHFVCNRCHRVLPISKFYCEGLHSLCSVEVVPYGVDIGRFSPPSPFVKDTGRSQLGIPRDARVLLCVQRLDPVKQVERVIAAFAIYLRERPDALLAIVGTGPERDRLEAEAIRAGVSRRVIFGGAVPEVELPLWYAAADVFITHSAFETFGLMFAEAMASGLPIVAPDATSVPYVVVDEVNGLLFDPANMQDVVRALRILDTNVTLAKSMGRRNRRTAEEVYNWDVIAARYENELAAASGSA